MLVLLVTGCASRDLPIRSFREAMETTGAVRVAGALEPSSVRRDSVRGVEFVLREPGTSATIQVRAQVGIPVPANLTAAESVVVTGRYDRSTAVLQAESVETRVPPRERQTGR